jgi:hypothetical protein
LFFARLALCWTSLNVLLLLSLLLADWAQQHHHCADRAAFGKRCFLRTCRAALIRLPRSLVCSCSLAVQARPERIYCRCVPDPVQDDAGSSSATPKQALRKLSCFSRRLVCCRFPFEANSWKRHHTRCGTSTGVGSLTLRRCFCSRHLCSVCADAAFGRLWRQGLVTQACLSNLAVALVPVALLYVDSALVVLALAGPR